MPARDIPELIWFVHLEQEMGCAGAVWAQWDPCPAYAEGNDHLQWLLSPRAAAPPPAVVLQVLWTLREGRGA